MFVAISDISCTRLAATIAGGTVIANAASYAAAAALAWAAVSSHSAAVVVSHSMYGATAAAIDADEGPSHAAPVRSQITY
jgi:hypothetical protein